MSAEAAVVSSRRAVILLTPEFEHRERRAARCRREADNASSFSTRAPLNLFLIQMLAERVMNFNISPPASPRLPFFLSIVIRRFQITHFLITNSFKLSSGVDK